MKFKIYLLLIFLLPFSCIGHEIRPASLDIIELKNSVLEFRWRQPVKGGYTIAIKPKLSSGWISGEPDDRIVTETSLISLWRIEKPVEALAGQRLGIEGLDRTITDVLLTIHYANGDNFTRLIKAANPTLQIPVQGASVAAIPEYLWLGSGHIWSGADHLLYILALILLIHRARALLLTITAFTVAHSITLACSALDLVPLRPAPVEAVISLSIVYVAVELVKARRGQPSLTSRAPWVVAFIFGLLHGFGFAGALLEIGLPNNAVAVALLLFNIGIEIGQLLFVVLVLSCLWLFRKFLPTVKNTVERLSPYVIGSMASFWLVQRLLAI